MFKLGWDTAQNFEESIQELGGWWVGGSNVILDPTLALIRAQLGFRIQVRAECGNIWKPLAIKFRSLLIRKGKYQLFGGRAELYKF